MKYILFGLFFAAMGPVAMLAIFWLAAHGAIVFWFLFFGLGGLVVAFFSWAWTTDAEIAERARIRREADMIESERGVMKLLRPAGDIDGSPPAFTRAPTPSVKHRRTAWASDPIVSDERFFRG